MMEVFDKNGSIIDLIKRDDYVLKTYEVKGITFDANKATRIGSPSDLGADESKIVIPFMIGDIVSTPLYDDINCFLFNRYNGIFLYTNYTQNLIFDIVWVEKK